MCIDTHSLPLLQLILLHALLCHLKNCFPSGLWRKAKIWATLSLRMILSLALSDPSSAIFLNGFVFVQWCLEFTNQTACEILLTCKGSPRALNEVTMSCKNDCFWDKRMEPNKGNTHQVNLKWVIWCISMGKLSSLNRKEKNMLIRAMYWFTYIGPTFANPKYCFFLYIISSFFHSFLPALIPPFLFFSY